MSTHKQHLFSTLLHFYTVKMFPPTALEQHENYYYSYCSYICCNAVSSVSVLLLWWSQLTSMRRPWNGRVCALPAYLLQWVLLQASWCKMSSSKIKIYHWFIYYYKMKVVKVYMFYVDICTLNPSKVWTQCLNFGYYFLYVKNFPQSRSVKVFKECYDLRGSPYMYTVF